VLRTLAAQMDHADLEELSERALNFQKQNLADGEEALTQLAKQAT
jgi:phage-related minor tail protein